MEQQPRPQFNSKKWLFSFFIFLLFLYSVTILHLYFRVYKTQINELNNLSENNQSSTISVEDLENWIFSWKNALQTKQYTFASNRPIQIYVDVGSGFFDFWYQQNVTNSCNIPCNIILPHELKNDQTVDAVLVHSGGDEIPSTISSPTILLAKMKNEPELIFATRCAQQHTSCQTDITISYRQESTIWSSYMYQPPVITSYDEMAEPFTEAACTFISNCVHHRYYFVEQMMNQIPVQNYGACLHNAETTDSKMNTLNQRCKFSLAFENVMQQDYVTEKYWQHYMVPQDKVLIVYRGASLFLKQFWAGFPKKTYVDTFDFGDHPIQVANYLQYLNQNQTAFEEYFEWKKDPSLVQEFQKRLQTIYEANAEVVPCKLCLAVAEMKQSRFILQQMGLQTKVSEDQFLDWKHSLLSPSITSSLESDRLQQLFSDLDLLYEMAYGRVWKPNNFASSWNSLQNSYKK